MEEVITTTFKIDGPEVEGFREILGARVRLRFEEKKHWLSRTFTVTGPASAIEAATKELADMRHEIWLSMQI
jgi:hypothetical protein